MYVHVVDGWMDGWKDGWMDGWMDGRMDGWMDGCSVLVRPFCGGVAPPIILSAPPTEVQISILHHQALLYHETT